MDSERGYLRLFPYLAFIRMCQPLITGLVRLRDIQRDANSHLLLSSTPSPRHSPQIETFTADGSRLKEYHGDAAVTESPEGVWTACFLSSL